jgi:hypothetical protein
VCDHVGCAYYFFVFMHARNILIKLKNCIVRVWSSWHTTKLRGTLMLLQGCGTQHQAILEMLTEPTFLHWVFSSVESQLAHAVAVHRANADIAAVWAPTPEVQRCCESMLRVPDWRPLVKPLIGACIVRTLLQLLAALCNSTKHPRLCFS